MRTRDLASGARGGIGSVHGIGFDGISKIFAEGAGSGFRGIRGAHDLAIAKYGVLATKSHEQDRAAGHETDQAFEEGTIFVLDVETFRLFARQTHHLKRLV